MCKAQQIATRTLFEDDVDVDSTAKILNHFTDLNYESSSLARNPEDVKTSAWAQHAAVCGN